MKTLPLTHDPAEFLPDVWAQRIGPSSSRPKTLVVCVHGTGGNGEEELKKQSTYAHPAFLQSGEAAVLIAPTYAVPYHFLVPGLGPKLVETLALFRQAFPSCRDKVRIWGFSGGAQFAHRFALQHPQHVDRVAALASGEWTLPDGRHDGMMSETDWFEREPFAQYDGLRAAAAVPAHSGWENIDWLIGCGRDDSPSRFKSAAWFAENLWSAHPALDVTFHDYAGDHNHTPPQTLRIIWDFLAKP